MSKKTCLFLPLCVLLFTATVQAATYFVPEDRELIQRSDDIVVATGVSSYAERNAHGAIVTRYTLRIEEVLKGDRRAGDHLVVTEMGGQLGEAIYYVPGSPEYVPGQRYLVFTDANRDLDPITWGMSLGQFAFVDSRDRSFAVRSEVFGFDGNLESFSERTRDAALFVEYIRGIVAQRIDPTPRYFVDDAPSRAAEANGVKWEPESQYTRTSYLMQAGGKGFRWQNPAPTFTTAGTPVGANGIAAVDLAIGQWNGTASSIDVKRGGHDDTIVGPALCNTCDNNRNTIIFNDPAGEIPAGVAGTGGVFADAQYSFGGETFYRVNEADLVMQDGAAAQNCYNTVMTHEMGHCLGFRHSNQPPSPTDHSSNDAIMRSSVVCSWNGVLKQYDQAAAATVYGSGPVCTNPSITGQPLSKSISDGTTTSLTVTAAGSGLTYQWYVGNSGDTSTTIGTNSATLTVKPSITTSYWVRVSGECGSPVNSATATITVTPFVCPAVTITGAAATAQTNGNFRLLVSATSSGQTLTYEWYQGATPGTGGNLVGTTASVNVSGALAAQYWAKVKNACGNSAVTELLSVTPCKAVITSQPQDRSISSGGNTTLAVDFAGEGVSVRWYRAVAPSKQNQVGTGSSISVGPLTATTQFWANLTNSCGETATRTVTVNVTGSCSAPVVTAEPQDQTIGLGATATLTVGFTGANTTVRWYQAAAPTKENEVGTGNTVTVGPLSVGTQYWASLTNSCGEVQTRTVTVNVTECTGPAITTQPAGQQDVVPGSTVTLSVAATGTGTLHHQWYEGAVDDVTKPVGTDAASFTSGPITANTSFWVLVTNDCGSAKSSAAPVEVMKPRRRAVGRS